MFQDGRADDQHPLDTNHLSQYFNGRDSLNGFAQPYIVADQAAAGFGGEQRAFALVGLQILFYNCLEFRAVDAGRKLFLNPFMAIPIVTNPRDELQHVFITTKVVSIQRSVFEKVMELGIPFRFEEAIAIEKFR